MRVTRRPDAPARSIDYAAFGGGQRSMADEGYADGYAAGYEAGRVEAANEHERSEAARRDAVARAIAAADAATEAARRGDEDRRTALDAQAPGFVFEILEILLGRESALAEDPGREAIARALVLDGTDRDAVARLHPDDVATLGELGDLAAMRTLTVVADPSVEPGGAVVELGETTIDSLFSEALARLRAVLVEHGGAGEAR